MNTIKIFISCNENIQIFTRDSHSWNTDVFIALDDNINGIYSQRVNILYIYSRTSIIQTPNNSKFSIIQNHFEVPTVIYVCILTLNYSIIQTKLFGPLDFELLRFHCIWITNLSGNPSVS